MILVQQVRDDSKVVITEMLEYDNEAIEKAKQKAKVFKSNGIILSDFEDMVWTLYNGKHGVTIKFDFNEFIFTRECKNREFYTYKQFIDSVKSYLVLVLDSMTILIAQSFVNCLKKITENTLYFREGKEYNWLDGINANDGSNITQLALVRDFVGFIQAPDIMEYRDRMLSDVSTLSKLASAKRKGKALNRRHLADFQSVFLFNKKINEYWERASVKEKLKFYPLYLWWSITCILPLRVGEFLVTPYDCIKKKENGDYTITIRRSKIKGKSNKTGTRRKIVTNSIEGDYKFYTYPVSYRIAELVLNYIDLTEKDRKNHQKELLFFNGNDDNPKSTFFKSELYYMLKTFEVKILQNEMGLTLRTRKELETDDENKGEVELDNKQHACDVPLPANEFHPIRFGDTRHFALINMVLNDFNPILVKDFAGHMDVNTSYHYFGNIADLVKCVSYTKYKELCEYDVDVLLKIKQTDITGNKILNTLSDDTPVIKLDNGDCSSIEFRKGSVKDCQEVSGECEICDFFVRTTKETKEERIRKMRILEDDIRKEGEFLGTILASYKDNIEDNKTITQSIVKIQSKAEIYMQDVKLNGGYYE